MEDGTEHVGDVEPGDAVKGGSIEEAGSVGEGGDDLSGCCTDWVWDLYDRQGAGHVGGDGRHMVWFGVCEGCRWGPGHVGRA